MKFLWFGSSAPPQHIVQLERLNEGQALRVLLWADVPTDFQRFYADANATSAYVDATADELKALRSGAVAERVEQINTVKLTTVTDPGERETLNAAFATDKEQPQYIKARNLQVKTYVQWEDQELTDQLDALWQRFQDEVNAGLKGGSDFSAYGETNEATP